MTPREQIEKLAEEWGRRAATLDAEADAPTKNDDERRTALVKFVVATSLRECAGSLRAVIASWPPEAPTTTDAPPCHPTATWVSVNDGPWLCLTCGAAR
jgi:thymidylate synthase